MPHRWQGLFWDSIEEKRSMWIDGIGIGTGAGVGAGVGVGVGVGAPYKSSNSGLFNADCSTQEDLLRKSRFPATMTTS